MGLALRRSRAVTSSARFCAMCLGGALGGGGAQMPQGGGVQTPQGGQPPSPPMKDLSDLTKQLGVMGGAGAAVFEDQFEHGQDVEQSHLDNIQSVFDRFSGAQRH